MNAVRSNVSFPHSSPSSPPIDGQRLSQSSHNSSFFLCESQVKVPTRRSSQTSPRCFCLSLCWSSVWGAISDIVCLRNGFQRTVFWLDPPVRATPDTPQPSTRRPHAGHSSPWASPDCPERRRQLKPGKEP